MNQPATHSAASPRSASAAVLLRAERISRTYNDGDVCALRDISLELRENEYLAIMGPSGSGKSTLLNLLGALDRPDAGEIYFRDQPLSKLADLDSFRAHTIGFVFQSFYLLPTLTAEENVQIPMFETRLSASQRQSRARELLNRVGMSHRLKHLPNKLSVGERQRVTIARALANQPRIILADEPTGNLDSQSGNDVLELFDKLQRELGVTLVVITHSAEVAARAGRIVTIRDGQLV